MSRRFMEISFKGAANSLLRAQFDYVSITVERGVTRLRVVVDDDSVLHGILDQISLLGLELLDVHRLDETPPPP